MHFVRRAWILLSVPLVSACAQDTLLGFAIGDVGGLWTASALEYVSNASSSTRVDIVARDGADLIMSVDDSVQPPTVGATLNDGLGGMTNLSGTVDIETGIITLGSDAYMAVKDGERLTMTNEGGSFDFGGGAESATVIIRLDRI